MFEATLDDELRLRMLCESDAEELFRVVDANRIHLREWLPWLDANTTPDHSREFIRSVALQNAQGQGFTCAILFRGQIVGVVGYHPIRWGNRSVELGYWLSREAVGRGIMTRCCRLLVDHAFHVLGLNRVAIPAAVGNRRSRAIPERLGFTLEGVIRDAEWLYDHFVDHALYAMLKRDWKGGPDGVANGGVSARLEIGPPSSMADSCRENERGAMKIPKPLILCPALLQLVGVVLGADGDPIVPTQNRFADELSRVVHSKLSFVRKKDSIEIQAKPGGTLPLEFVPGKGLQASDGSLVVGEGFAWPGCGFDRTSYMIREIASQFVVIGYTRGIPQQDGYQDSGEIRIEFGNGRSADPGVAGSPAAAPDPRNKDQPKREAETRSR